MVTDLQKNATETLYKQPFYTTTANGEAFTVSMTTPFSSVSNSYFFLLFACVLLTLDRMNCADQKIDDAVAETVLLLQFKL